VIHLAARVHEIPRTSAEREAFWAINADAPRRLADQARRAGVSTLVFASTVAVYGDTDGSDVIDESATCRPQTLYARAKYVAERHWMEAGGTVLRFAWFSGPFDRGSVATLLHKVRAGRAMIVGRGYNRKSLVYSANICGQNRPACLQPGRFPGAVFNVVDSSPTQRELILAIAHAVGCRPPGQLPTVPAFVGGTLLDLLNYARGQRTRWRENLRKLTLNTEFDGCRLDRMLGYKPRVSLKSGLAECPVAPVRSDIVNERARIMIAAVGSGIASYWIAKWIILSCGYVPRRDFPALRRLHQHVTPRGGGLGVLLFVSRRMCSRTGRSSRIHENDRVVALRVGIAEWSHRRSG
jgi:nucleoside-diphosphate-sugar epimerase